MMMAMSSVVASAALSPRASPSASLSLLSSARTSSVQLLRFPSPHVPQHVSSFISPSTSLSFTSSSLSGLSLGNDFSHRIIVKERHRVFRVSARKYALGQTKRARSRKSLARTHGFRRRMRTTSGRAVLKRRRAKGRKVLCPKSYPRSGPMS